MTEVAVTTGAIRRAKLQSNRHHQQSNPQLFTGRMPLLSPNQQSQSTEEKSITLHGLAHPKLTWGLLILSLTIKAHGYLSAGFLSLRQPSDASTTNLAKELLYKMLMQVYQTPLLISPQFCTDQGAAML